MELEVWNDCSSCYYWGSSCLQNSLVDVRVEEIVHVDWVGHEECLGEFAADLDVAVFRQETDFGVDAFYCFYLCHTRRSHLEE